ncbi:MAG: thiamine diphosphokinase [Anaerolineae bacterium]|nr:thiamine diphosphokinase [Anaerolineales bacterium]MCQ3972888.1 thiamine diphosphokinase [Anaerolineae bacterium]
MEFTNLPTFQPMTRIVIFANGNLSEPDKLRRRLRPTDRIFCADGGTVHALALGLTPELIIGDFDSLPPNLMAGMKAAGVNFQRHPARKDQTDLELAFQTAVAEGVDEILLVTALGGRLDQMLANIFLLARPEYASVRLTLVDGSQSATVLGSHQTLTLTGQPGDTLSLVPLTPTVQQVNLSGVEWPLVEATLTFGSTWSISNAFTTPQATVQIGEGMVLVVHIETNERLSE